MFQGSIVYPVTAVLRIQEFTVVYPCVSEIKGDGYTGCTRYVSCSCYRIILLTSGKLQSIISIAESDRSITVCGGACVVLLGPCSGPTPGTAIVGVIAVKGSVALPVDDPV